MPDLAELHVKPTEEALEKSREVDPPEERFEVPADRR